MRLFFGVVSLLLVMLCGSEVAVAFHYPFGVDWLGVVLFTLFGCLFAVAGSFCVSVNS